MSIPNPSEGSSERVRGSSLLQINADEADLSDVVTSSRGGGGDHAPPKFTEEEMIVHTIHKEACEVRCVSSNPILSS